MENRYDALLIVSFGGPEGMDEVMPFLENVLRGRNVPRERMIEVSHHYEMFGGVSPINGQNRALIAALKDKFAEQGLDLPIYWGNRNWTPLLPDTLRQMTQDGIKNALAFFTSAYSSYSGCRQYREDVARAQQASSSQTGLDAPQVNLLRKFYNHPGFIGPNVENIRAALDHIPAERRATTPIAFTAHSIPESMARTSMYVAQLRDTCGLIAAQLDHAHWQLVYQSRSGSPSQPWLGPDMTEHLRDLKVQGRNGCCGRASGLCLGSHGSAVRPGSRGVRSCQRDRLEYGTGGDGRHESGIYRHDLRSHRRAHDRSA